MVHNKILIIEDDRPTLDIIRQTLGNDFELDVQKDIATVASLEGYVLAIIDYQQKGPQLLKQLKLKEPSLRVLIISREQNLAEVIMAIKMGGTYFLSKPLVADVLRQTVHRVLEGMTFEMLEVSGEYPWYLTTEPRVEELLKMAKNVALHTMDAILCGESGTGKEALSIFIHQNGTKRPRQFATLNVSYYRGQAVETHFWAALREIYQEYESNVLGQREPLYSTLYIEGIETQDLYFRMSLLDWLQKKRKESAGKYTMPLRVILGITSPATFQGVAENLLSDCIWLSLIPLRDRREDIPLLIDHFIKRYDQEYSKNVQGCTLEALQYLMTYSWPGNLRELQLMMQMVMARIPAAVHILGAHDLPLSVRAIEDTIPTKRFSAVVTMPEAVALYEEKLLRVLSPQLEHDPGRIAAFLGETTEVVEDKLTRYAIHHVEGEAR